MVEGIVNGLLIIGVMVWFFGAVALAVCERAAEHPIYRKEECLEWLIESPFGRILTRYSPWAALAWPVLFGCVLVAAMLGLLPEKDD